MTVIPPTTKDDATSRPLPPNRKLGLVTGYGPFGNFAVNPSYQSVRKLQARQFPSNDPTTNVLIHVMEVPVEYHRVYALTPTLYTTYPLPRFALHVGANGQLAPAHIQLETRARNGPYVKKDVIGQLPNNEYSDCIPSDIQDGKKPESIELRTAEHILNQVVEKIQIRLNEMHIDEKKHQELAFQLADTHLEGENHASATTNSDSTKTISDDISGIEATHTSSSEPWNISTSPDAGLFLCEYIFYHSLYWARESSCIEKDVNETTVFFLHVPSVNAEKGHRSQEELNRVLEVVVGILCEVCG